MSNFTVSTLPINGLLVITPTVYEDTRGTFMEVYHHQKLQDLSMPCFVQENESYSKFGVVRGLHLQSKHSQGKLIRVVEGEVFDVAVDLRKNSKTYGQWYGLNISSENKKQFYIPEEFAHGFMVLSRFARLIYKCTDYYYPEYETGILWNDTTLNIHWPLVESLAIVSDKDRILPAFNEVPK